jgi:hypothetical protein
LRLLQTVDDVAAAEKNSTRVMPFPSNCSDPSTAPPPAPSPATEEAPAAPATATEPTS